MHLRITMEGMARAMRGGTRSLLPLLVALLLLCARRSTANADDDTVVTCGSHLKLEHEGTKARLHSHGVAYGASSTHVELTTDEES